MEERSVAVAMCEQHNGVLVHYNELPPIAIGRSGGHGNERTLSRGWRVAGAVASKAELRAKPGQKQGGIQKRFPKKSGRGTASGIHKKIASKIQLQQCRPRGSSRIKKDEKDSFSTAMEL
jgi:hypothetical protein